MKEFILELRNNSWKPEARDNILISANRINTVVYFDWKTVIYIYACGNCRIQFMLPMEKSVTFTGTYANEIIPSIHRSFVYKANEGGHVRILTN